MLPHPAKTTTFCSELLQSNPLSIVIVKYNDMAENQNKGSSSSRKLRNASKPDYSEQSNSEDEGRHLDLSAKGSNRSSPPPPSPSPSPSPTTCEGNMTPSADLQPVTPAIDGTAINPPQWFLDYEKKMEKYFDDKFSERDISEKFMRKYFDDKFSEFAQNIKNAMEEIESLKKEVKYLKEENVKIKSENDKNIAENEEKERNTTLVEAEKIAENIILSGTSIPDHHGNEDIVNVAIETLRNNTNVNVNRSDFAHAYRPKKKMQNGYVYDKKIVIKFHSKTTKRDTVQSNFTAKPSGLFINEQLTKTVDEIHYQLRKLKKSHAGKIAVLYTKNGVIRVRKTKQGSLYSILTTKDFNKFIRDAQLPNPLDQQN